VTAQGKKSTQRKQLGLAIRNRRESFKLSQEKLAELVDVHRNYVGLIERGEQNLTVDTLCRLAGALKCRPSDLLCAARL
jgi:transcriptional regulator with XRE-family HTH domain